MKNLRISFGPASCKNNPSKNPLVRGICKLLNEKLEALKALSYEQAKMFNQEESEPYTVKGEEVLLTIYKEAKGDDVYIIVQVFKPTWFFPNYISINGVGKLFADGVVFRRNGTIEFATDSDLWSFR